MWSAAPTVKEHHVLQTGGPYRLSRHPIYTGILGMLLGSLLLAGAGRWILPFPVFLALFEIKIRIEERLMLAEFPGDYQRYRERVPQLIPGLRLPRRRPMTARYRDLSRIGLAGRRRLDPDGSHDLGQRGQVVPRCIGCYLHGPDKDHAMHPEPQLPHVWCAAEGAPRQPAIRIAQRRPRDTGSVEPFIGILRNDEADSSLRQHLTTDLNG